MIWFRSHVEAVCSHGSPTDVSLPGWQPVPSALGWPCAMFATAVCHYSGVVFWMDVIFLQVALGSLPLVLPLRDTSLCGLTQERLGGCDETIA